MKKSDSLSEVMRNAAALKNVITNLLPEEGPFRAMFEMSLHPDIIGCIQDVQEVLAFEIPESQRQSFLLFHDFLTNPQPHFITEWRSTAAGNRWYVALAELNGATRNAYGCVLYHSQRLCQLESAVMKKLSTRNYASVVGNSVVGVGNTLVWDFEYQAFVLAYRRCLDYMTRGLAAFFKQDFHSFRDLPDKLKNRRPENVARALIKVHAKHCGNFDLVVSHGDKKSVRDKISHYEWVSAATINLTKNGLVLAGGGEALHLKQAPGHGRLTASLTSRVEMLKACIDEMLTTFVTEARAWDVANQRPSA